MVRTVISFDPDDKAWLDEKAKRERVTMAELVRRAIRRMREEERTPSFDEVLERARGSWRHGDGLEYQLRIREEWER
ncbi:MAG: ribbon-helix-helix protein, CopG family [Gemmatimonadetes bacterium]|nr:ribbon-helix-helix protein, CopG family [Gemmatimonadota bacterium]